MATVSLYNYFPSCRKWKRARTSRLLEHTRFANLCFTNRHILQLKHIHQKKQDTKHFWSQKIRRILKYLCQTAMANYNMRENASEYEPKPHPPRSETRIYCPMQKHAAPRKKSRRLWKLLLYNINYISWYLRRKSYEARIVYWTVQNSTAKINMEWRHDSILGDNPGMQFHFGNSNFQFSVQSNAF